MIRFESPAIIQVQQIIAHLPVDEPPSDETLEWE